MFTLEIKKGKQWCKGIRQYATYKEARIRRDELIALGMKVQIVFYL